MGADLSGLQAHTFWGVAVFFHNVFLHSAGQLQCVALFLNTNATQLSGRPPPLPCRQMSAQAIELPFSSQAPSEKASSTANDIKSRVSTSTDSAAEQMKYSANDPASKVQNAACK